MAVIASDRLMIAKIAVALGITYGLAHLLKWRKDMAEEEREQACPWFEPVGHARAMWPGPPTGFMLHTFTCQRVCLASFASDALTCASPLLRPTQAAEPVEEEKAETIRDVQVVLGVCVLLVAVTIGFEKLKHHVEHELPHHMLPVISALFGELTVLGFIALYTYFMLQTGVLPEISEWVYHDEEQLVEQFESVHFTLFFVMVTFLVQAYLLLCAAMRLEQRYGEIEDFLKVDGHSAPCQKCADAVLVAKHQAETSRLGPLDLRARRELSRARFALQYALLRQRFILHPRLPNAELLPRNFNFHVYLRTLLSEMVSHMLHVTELTWVIVVSTLFVALELPVAFHQFGADGVARVFHAHVTPPDFTHVGWLVGFTALLCLGIALLDAKLAHILHMITPPHALLSPKDTKAAAARAARAARGRSSSITLAEPLLLPPSLHGANGSANGSANGHPVDGWVDPPLDDPRCSGRWSTSSSQAGRLSARGEGMEETSGRSQRERSETVPPAFFGGATLDANGATPHEQLFWGGRRGPQLFLTLVRTSLLLNAVAIAVVYSWLCKRPDDAGWLLVALLPLLHVAFSGGMQLVAKLVLVTSVEKLRKPQAVKDTLNEMKTEHTLNILKLLTMMQVHARRANERKARRASMAANGAPLSPGKPPTPRRPPLNAGQKEEFRSAFNLFDADNSGYIDEDELANVMRSLGLDLDANELHLLFIEMDVDGGGTIDFDEFCVVMAQGQDGVEQSSAEVADAIFNMIDLDSSGTVETSELKNLLRRFEMGDDEIDNAVALFDVDHDGTITKKEFCACVDRMRSIAK